MKKALFILILIFLIATITGCNGNNTGSIEEVLIEEDEEESGIKELNDEEIENAEKEEIDLYDIKPNENGQIMIIMYHGISKEESEWVRTIDNFKKDLKSLYDNGYRLLNLSDYVNNNISTEAGFTPVVLTFDDGLQNQFNYVDENGVKVIDPDCAVGILEEFCKNHPDFGKGASFFVYYPVPFRQSDFIYDKFKFLIENGYEIGNHGYNHENLGKISIDKVQESLAKNAQKTYDILSGYTVQTLALPYGAAPKGNNYKYVIKGEYNGFSYNNKAVLKVGSNPAFAPNHIKFDSERLPRVRGSEILVNGTGMYDYIEYFKKNPEKRYISDGNKDTVTIPESELPNFNMDSIGEKNLITYLPDKSAD
ncbi:MAG: polysaccharide deacetylase family protein [Firmicutes bacterium]|nr:polysaccharide deacetylase family protein [Bacillota bacterium]